MLFWWQMGQVESKLGYVAENCPSCREPRVCQLTARGLRPKLYSVVPVGRLRIQSHAAQCTTCSRTFEVEAAFYSTVLPEAGDLGPVKMRTHPALGGVGQSPEEARLHRGLHALLEANTRLNQRYASGSTVVDLRVGLSIAAVLAVLVSAIWLVGLGAEWMVYVWGSALVVSIVQVIVAIATERRRFIRTKLTAELKATLAQRQLQRADLDRAYKRLQQHNYEIVRDLDLSSLHSQPLRP